MPDSARPQRSTSAPIATRRPAAPLDEDALYRRALAAYARNCRRAGGEPLIPSRRCCGLTSKGFYELANTYEVLARFRYNATADRLYTARAS